MKILILGGTGLISVGIVKHLLAGMHEVTMVNRGKRENVLPSEVSIIHADRSNPMELENAVEGKKWDVVIDMICFTPAQAEQDVLLFARKCDHFIFCSTVCTYGVKIPNSIIIDETFPQEPISGYGKNKLLCEKIFLQAHAEAKFNVTIIRPSHTYGPGSQLIDNLEPDSVAWDRIEKGKPVICAGDGMGLWVSTYRDDVGKLFAGACLNDQTYGQCYNATRETVLTWREYYRQVSYAVGKRAKVLFLPASWIIQRDPKRFGLLAEITQFHGAYTSAKARRDVPIFDCVTELRDGAEKTLLDQRRRGAWRNSDNDETYEAMVATALSIGVEPVML